ncbi:MAG: phosphoribosylamine--glycine ligase [Desulfomonile sp.]|nr:phosphoribosylamine--glycine ligase [Desulfomonile sp.]
MKVLLVGSGGREHALAWKVAQSPEVSEVIVAPGNAGIAREPKCRLANVSAEDIPSLLDLAIAEKVGLVIVGPEAPLVNGLADVFTQSGLKVFGPPAKGALIEGSKVFAKNLMRKHGVPSAEFEVFDDYDRAAAYLKELTGPVVVKADGLAAGKGVLVCKDQAEALEALALIMKERTFGQAGDRVVIEECLTGEEASFIAFTDGEYVLPLASSQDHKPIFDDDKGPNTGGMGAYSPAPVVTHEIHDIIMKSVMIPTVEALAQQGSRYVGFLYAGLMIDQGSIKVLEFNARMGDPEAQPLLMRMKSDPVPLMLAAIDGNLRSCEIEWEPEDAVCVVMASGGYPASYAKGKPISGIAEAERLDGVKVFHAGTRLAGDGFVTSGGRVLGVTARGNGIAAAIDKAYEAVGKITWENVHYRRDIGKKALNRL